MSLMKTLSSILSRPIVLHLAMPILIIYLVIGTVAQKYIGLYEATNLFFSSPILWLGFVPLPGMPIIVGLIFINLSFKLIFKSDWTPRHAGIIITHIGALLLLLGGLVTALFSHEGYLDFASGEQKSYVSDYHIRELVVVNDQGQPIATFNHQSLSSGDVLTLPNSPLTISITETCRHCGIQKREDATDTHYGMAQHMELHSADLRLEDEENMAGTVFTVTGSDQDGTYLVLENVPQIPKVTQGDQTYRFVLRRQQRALPFTVELLDFKRDLYPGTEMAKSYASRVRIIDGDAQWESLIQMNEPLRYKGYTLFQSSFIATPEGDISVLTVVWNVGRSFPYISGIVMCLGLIIHLVMRRKYKGQLSS